MCPTMLKIKEKHNRACLIERKALTSVTILKVRVARGFAEAATGSVL